jgi:copper chaperone
MAKLVLKVEGMSCGHCVRTVTNALESVNGVVEARVDLASGRADVDYNEAAASAAQLVGAVVEEGYGAHEV